MDLQQARFEAVDAFIERADNSLPVTGLDESTLIFRLKKKGEVTFSTKTFFATTSALGVDVSPDATQIYFDSLSDLDNFPITGSIWIDKGGGNPEPAAIPYTRIAGLDYVTLTSGVTLSHSAADVITLHDFWEVGFGVYTFLLDPTDTDTLGNLIYVADPTDTAYKTVVTTVEVVPATGPGVAPSVISIPNCIISDYVADIHGQPLQNVGVSFRVIGEPEIEANVGISERVFQVNSDADGYFEATIIQGVDAYVTIPEISFTKVITVPYADSAQLFDL